MMRAHAGRREAAWAAPSLKRWSRMALARGPVYRWARARCFREGAITVLMYHTLGRDDEEIDAWTVVRQGDFLKQVEHLRSHYEVVSIDEALAHQPPRESRNRPLAVITFDDGHAGLHAHLLPIVETLRLPVTIYVATGHIESGRPYWFDRTMAALQVRVPVEIDLSAQGLRRWTVGSAHGESRWQEISGLLEALKAVAPDRREQLCATIESITRDVPRSDAAPLAPLTLDQLRALARSRWITLGAHTHGHELLDALSLPQACETIEHSRSLLQRWTGRHIDHFAYPNGNHTPELAREVERLRFRSAFTTVHGLWRAGADPYRAPRVPVGRYDTMDKFRLDLLGGPRAVLGWH